MSYQLSSNQQLVEAWLQEYKSDATFYTYRTAAERFIRFLGNLQISQLQLRDVERFVAALEIDTELSPNSVRSYKAAVRSLLGYTLGQSDLLEPLSIAYPSRNRLADIQVVCCLDELLSQEKEPQNRVILLLTVVLDCLVSEVLNLTWADVNYAQHSLTLYELPQQQNRVRRYRTVSLCESIWRELVALRQDRTLNQHVFHGVKGRLDSPQINRIISKALKRVGINATPNEVCFSLKKTPRKYQIIAPINF